MSVRIERMEAAQNVKLMMARINGGEDITTELILRDCPALAMNRPATVQQDQSVARYLMLVSDIVVYEHLRAKIPGLGDISVSMYLGYKDPLGDTQAWRAQDDLEAYVNAEAVSQLSYDLFEKVVSTGRTHCEIFAKAAIDLYFAIVRASH